MTESMPDLAQSPSSKFLLPMCNFFETITYVLADTLIFALICAFNQPTGVTGNETALNRNCALHGRGFRLCAANSNQGGSRIESRIPHEFGRGSVRANALCQGARQVQSGIVPELCARWRTHHPRDHSVRDLGVWLPDGHHLLSSAIIVLSRPRLPLAVPAVGMPACVVMVGVPVDPVARRSLRYRTLHESLP